MKHKTLKILVIGTTDTQGGAARVGWDIGHELMSHGHDVKYIVGYKKSTHGYVYELSKRWLTKWVDEHTRYNATSLVRHFRSYLLSNTLDFGASDEILNHPWYKEADIIHLHNLHGNFFRFETLKKLDREKKVVWTLHDMWAVTGKCAYTEDQSEWSDGYHKCETLLSYPPTLWDNTRYMWEKKKTLYQQLSNTTIVSPSDWLSQIASQSIVKHLPRVVIHNGIDQSVFTLHVKPALRSQLGLPQNKKIIAFVAQGGQSDPRKGWRYVQTIIAQYKDATDLHFLAIGDGQTVENLPNVTTIPFILDKKTLAKYYSASDLLLFTSLAENCPLVILEGMSCGLPIVSFDVGGVPELVLHKQNGYIAKYKDVEDLQNGVKWVLGLGDTVRVKMSKANRARVEKNFTTKIMVDKYEKLFNQL